MKSEKLNTRIMLKVILFFSLFAFNYSLLSAQSLPSTDVYLINIQQKSDNFKLADSAKPIDISNNKGYDNQPMFIEPLNSIAYVSSRNNGPTDVYLYHLDTKTVTQFTNTPEAEYSPKITPDGKAISVVKGAEQNLTRISFDGTQTEKIYTCKDSIGYYCWLSPTQIMAVVLTRPITLKLITLPTRNEKFLTDSIGRSLFRYNGGAAVCFTLHSGNSIAYIDGKGNCRKWINEPNGTEDFYLTADGWLFSSDGSKLVYCNVKNLAAGWQVLADLKPMGISKVFRLSVNQQKNKLAFVVEEK
jgi:WD40 repeat protein